jgi:hypothetical protein
MSITENGIIKLGVVKFDRAPADVRCCSTIHEGPRLIPFGVHCYLNVETQQAVCSDCGDKLAWSQKDRIKKIIGAKEIQHDIGALKKERKTLVDAVILLKNEVNIYRIAEQNKELEQQKQAAINMIGDYLGRGIATNEEKLMFQRFIVFLHKTEARQAEMKDEVSNYLKFHVITAEMKKKKNTQNSDDNDEAEQAAEEHAEEVAAEAK